MAFRDSINDLMFRFYEMFKKNNNRLPVSVDADINVGDVQIGTVKQGGVDEGAEPWKVKAEELEQKIDALKQSIESGVQLKGQTVEDVNGALAVRTKQTALAYTTWHFNDQAEVVVSAGSSIRESQARLVNGFSTLAFILRLENPNSSTNHTVQVDALWLSVPVYQSARRAIETLWDKPTGGNGVGTLSALGETSTKAEYVMLEIRNKDTIDHGYHISALLRV